MRKVFLSIVSLTFGFYFPLEASRAGEDFPRTSPANARAILKFACPRSKVELSFSGKRSMNLPILSLKVNGKRIKVSEEFLDISKVLSSLQYVSGECDQGNDRIVLSFSGPIANRSIDSVSIFLSVQAGRTELEGVHCVMYADFAKSDAPAVCDRIWQFRESL